MTLEPSSESFAALDGELVAASVDGDPVDDDAPVASAREAIELQERLDGLQRWRNGYAVLLALAMLALGTFLTFEAFSWFDKIDETLLSVNNEHAQTAGIAMLVSHSVTIFAFGAVLVRLIGAVNQLLLPVRVVEAIEVARNRRASDSRSVSLKDLVSAVTKSK